MDQIKITIEQEQIDDGAMFVGVHINGNDMPGILNLEAFFAIKRENELVPLFTCGCGIFDCGGYFQDNLIDHLTDFRQSFLMVPR